MKIIEMATRLPGPLAGHYLSKNGIEVVKLNDINFSDPFLAPDVESIFQAWHGTINKNKVHHDVDYSNLEIEKYLGGVSCIMVAMPEKMIEKLKLRELAIPVVELHSSKDHNPVHDLNLLYASGILELQNFAMPALPFAGLQLANVVTQKVFNAILNFRLNGIISHAKVYADDVVNELAQDLWPKEVRSEKNFLHNGSYPCYNVYQTIDGVHMALAAAEVKYWSKFCELFQLNFSIEDRFNTKIIKEIENLFNKLTVNEIKAKVKDHQICLSLPV